MKQLSRRTAIRILAAGGGLLGAGLAGGYALHDLLGSARSPAPAAGGPVSPGTQGSMMGDVTRADMRTYTEADAPVLVAQLQAHVASMYTHLNQGAEVSCMSSSLPVLFRNSRRYRRSLTNTAK